MSVFEEKCVYQECVCRPQILIPGIMDQAKELFEKLALLVTTPDCYDEFFNKMNFMHGKKRTILVYL